MRYVARWSNGFWKVFDRTKFADAAVCATQRGAEEAAVDFNVGEASARPRPKRRQ